MPESLDILMVAPQPFFRPRGTPFSILHRIRALTELGHRVELIAYPFGEDVEIPGLSIRRTSRPPFIRDVGIGPSFSKIALDLTLSVEVRRRVESHRFDLIHTHEEAGFLGAWLSRSHGIPHLYDMHSSLPQQFANFGRFNWAPVVKAFSHLERFALKHCAGAIVVYPDLARHVRELGFEGPLAVIENTLDFEYPTPDEGTLQSLRDRLGVGDAPLVVYTGTLESYQGMDVLIDASVFLREMVPGVRVASIGGTDPQVDNLRKLARAAGVEGTFSFLPAVPPTEVHAYQQLADVLVTSRVRGDNTPLKIYQFLRSGKPIVATSIRAHRQVLDETVAELVPLDPRGVAEGLARVLLDPQYGRRLAANARILARERYHEQDYMDALEHLLSSFMTESAART